METLTSCTSETHSNESLSSPLCLSGLDFVPTKQEFKSAVVETLASEADGNHLSLLAWVIMMRKQSLQV